MDPDLGDALHRHVGLRTGPADGLRDPSDDLSLAYAIGLTGAGLAVALWRALPAASVIGGLILGGGIAAMHYTGMAAFEVPGHLKWDPTLVAASLILGWVLAAIGLQIGLTPRRTDRAVVGALLLLAAICSHHFTAMGAVTIVPDPSVSITDSALPTRWIGAGVALASIAILVMACAALMLDLRERRQASLGTGATEQPCQCRFRGIAGVPGGDHRRRQRQLRHPRRPVGPGPVRGAAGALPAGGRARLALAGQPDQPIEAELRGAEGESIPVELIVRPVTYGNTPHYAVAVRDLRARARLRGRSTFLPTTTRSRGLANRASFTLRLEREIKLAAATGGKLAVLCLDLDRFKEVNDLFGHAAGDAHLVTVARTVTALSVRTS